MPGQVRCFFATVVCLAAVVMAPAPRALATTPVIHFDVPPQPLGDALRTVASQAKTNVMFSEHLVTGRRSDRLQMEGTLDEVLAKLLENTGVSYRFLNEHTVVLTGSDSSASTDKETSTDLQLAQAASADTSCTPARRKASGRAVAMGLR